jgi:hypothetical protein
MYENTPKKKKNTYTVTFSHPVTGKVMETQEWPKYPKPAAAKMPKPMPMDPNAKIQKIKLSKPKRKITPANPTNSIPKPLPILSNSIEKGIKKGLNNYKR